MQFFDWIYLDNSLERWTTAVALAAFTLAVLRIAKAIAIRKLSARPPEARGSGEELSLRLVEASNFLVLVVIALGVGSSVLTLPDRLGDLRQLLLVVSLGLQAGSWGNVAVRLTVARAVERRLEHDPAGATTVQAVGFLGRLALWVVIALVAIEALGQDVTPLLAALGVGGIAVALAVQSILSDLFASLSIVLDKPFVIGDFIIVDDMLGSVEHIGLKTTRVRSLSGEQIVFSNADLLSSRIRNYKRMVRRRVEFSFGVTYQTRYEQLAAIPGIVREIVEAQDTASFDRAHFFRYGDSSLDFEVVYYVMDPDYDRYMDIQQAINLELYRRFEEEGISFAYPTRTLYVRQAGVESIAGRGG